MEMLLLANVYFCKLTLKDEIDFNGKRYSNLERTHNLNKFVNLSFILGDPSDISL